jgi:hypothetical protein
MECNKSKCKIKLYLVFIVVIIINHTITTNGRRSSRRSKRWIRSRGSRRSSRGSTE